MSDPDIHIDNHVNFIFHADQGKIIGAAGALLHLTPSL
jgi:hypothetical protein